MRSSRRDVRGSASASNKSPKSSSSSSSSEPRWAFRLHNGLTALFVDGKAQAPVFVDAAASSHSSQIAADVEAGVRLFRVRIDGLGWTGPNQSDFARLDVQVRELLANAPQALFLLHVNVEAPEWWLRTYAMECAAFCLPANRPEGTEAGLGKNSADTFACASRASRRWLSEAGDALARLARHVSGAEWGGQCVGFQVAAGEDGEWRHPEWARLPDISPRMTERFRAFCVDKYRRNEGLLRKGWDDPRASFDRIHCPNAYERRYADVGVLRDSLRSRRILDYYECFYDVQNEAALHFCSLLKRIGQGRVVGLAYALPFGTTTNAEGAHGFPEAVFDSDDVDYLVMGGSHSDMPVTTGFGGSMRLRGKAVLYVAGSTQQALATAGLAQTQLAGVIVPAETIPTDMKSIIGLYERSLNVPVGISKRNVQTAVIADAAGLMYLAGKDEARALWNLALYREQMEELAKTGAEFDVYLLSDLFHPKFTDHKVTVFLNTFYLSEAERRRIEARVKRGNQMSVWFWGAGLLSETGVDVEGASKLVGMKLRLEKSETSLRTRIVEGNDAFTWGNHVGTTFGPERSVLPTLTVGDKAATRLGANTANKTTFAAVRNENWTSEHFGTLPVPAGLLRNALRATGVHLYVDGAGGEARVHANGRLVTITSLRAGTFNVFLPGAHEVTDAVSRAKIATGSDISLSLKAGETRLLELKLLLRKISGT